MGGPAPQAQLPGVEAVLALAGTGTREIGRSTRREVTSAERHDPLSISSVPRL